ncbi:hypothetical protein pb186bvf_001218 [Paramecium bursaria]
MEEIQQKQEAEENDEGQENEQSPIEDEYKEVLNPYLSQMDRLQIPYFEKSKGQQEFQNNNYFEATKRYSKAIMAYQFLAKDGKLSDIQLMEKYVADIYLPCNLNLSLCYIKQKSFQLAKDFASKALQVEKTNVKALYRRAFAQVYLQEFKEAKKDLKLLLEQDPQNEEAKNLQLLIAQKVEKQKNRDKQISQAMINSLDYSDQPKQEQQIKQQSIGFFRNIYNKIKQVLTCQRKKVKKA